MMTLLIAVLGLISFAQADAIGTKVLYSCNATGSVTQNDNDTIQIAEDAMGNIQVTAVYGPYRTPDAQLNSLSAMLGESNATTFDFQAGSCISLSPLNCTSNSREALTLQVEQEFNLASTNPNLPSYDVLTVTAVNSTQRATTTYACHHWVQNGALNY